MCNLSGYSGVRQFSPQIMKLLISLGTRRGSDGVGIYMGRDNSGKNMLFKYYGYKNGIDEAKGTDLIFGKTVTPTNLLLLHNRARSVGGYGLQNTHPFLFNTIEGKTYIFAHNGTIKNIHELCTKYGIARDTALTDSQQLGEIIYNFGFNVLTEYVGYAAFSLYHVEEDTLYLWKGSSQCDSARQTEERPLHYYQNKDKTKLYYSSEAGALVTALNTDHNIKEVEDNTLMSIKQGQIINTEIFDRSHITFETKPATTTNNSYFNRYDDAYNDAFGYTTAPINESRSYRKRNKKSYFKKEKELSPQNDAGSSIYFFKGQYWLKGHLMDGVYMIDNQGRATKIEEKYYNVSNESIYSYFVEGYMLDGEELYSEACATGTLKNYTIEELSYACVENTIQFYKNSKTGRDEIWSEGVKVPDETEIRPVYSDRYYYINAEGKLKWSDISDESKKWFGKKDKNVSNVSENSETQLTFFPQPNRTEPDASDLDLEKLTNPYHNLMRE